MKSILKEYVSSVNEHVRIDMKSKEKMTNKEAIERLKENIPNCGAMMKGENDETD